MGDTERSDFLLIAANEGRENLDRAIYMKSLLSQEAYENFRTVVEFLEDDQLEDLVEITNGVDETDRNDFLKMASGAATSGQYLGTFIQAYV